MSGARRKRPRGRKISGRFVAIPIKVLESAAYIGLSAAACRLLIDLLLQFNGQNNGDFTLAWKTAQARGWTSKATLGRARDELLRAGFVRITRQGGRHRCSLYAITWLPIDACGGKLDVSSTRAPSHDWKRVGNPPLSAGAELTRHPSAKSAARSPTPP